LSNTLGKIKKNRYFLVFILLFAYAQSVHARLSIGRELNRYILTPDAAVATLITVSILFLLIYFFIQLWHKSGTFSMKEMLKIFAASLLAYLCIVQLLGFLIAFIFDNIERNFNSQTFIQSTFTYLIDGFIYGSFFLVFYYYKKNKQQQEHLTAYNRALYDSRMSQLKAQLNPHFLFNNLNVLDQLIYEDKNRASAFLNEFAEIYRYVLQSAEQSYVSIKEELAFAEQYFKVIQHKYGNSYTVTINLQNSQGFIIPLTLQLLIENVIKHNLGTEEKPVSIEINIGDNIFVSNNRVPKRKVKSESGKALSNLKEQYMILTNRQVEINESDEQFSVLIPKIKVQQAE
jgi:sensor histidine kinase YesM